MANEEHLARLLAGVEEWNQWWQENQKATQDLNQADFWGADLIRVNLIQANLSGVNLSGVNLSGAILTGAILTGANLSKTQLRRADLRATDLTGANFTGANLVDADLSQADFTGATLIGAILIGASLLQANLSRADLSRADLARANLDEANLSEARLNGARLYRTIFTGVDLQDVQGLDTVDHAGPSIVGIDTLYISEGQIPEVFLRGCGVPDSMIEYARALVAAERPIDYYSCFISYSSHDQALAERLHADLQAQGVRCWFAPHDLKIGESILGGIDQGIRLHDKLLLLLSESSIRSTWVQTEVNLALHREHTERRRVLFPVRLDDAVLTSGAAWAALIRADHHIGDFCQWKEHDSYQAVFARLLRDLQATP